MEEGSKTLGLNAETASSVPRAFALRGHDPLNYLARLLGGPRASQLLRAFPHQFAVTSNRSLMQETHHARSFQIGTISPPP